MFAPIVWKGPDAKLTEASDDAMVLVSRVLLRELPRYQSPQKSGSIDRGLVPPNRYRACRHKKPNYGWRAMSRSILRHHTIRRFSVDGVGSERVYVGGLFVGRFPYAQDFWLHGLNAVNVGALDTCVERKKKQACPVALRR